MKQAAHSWSELDYTWWVAWWTFATDSVIWWWESDAGVQPVLMPNDRYRWN
jgi:hypothetical protein